ncbi:MAG: T9SS type A sorting domain-containing protein [bacterium]
MFRKIIGVVSLFLMGATVNAWQQDAITNIGQLDSGGTISALTTALNGRIYGSTESGNIFVYDSASGIQELGYVGMNVNAIITGNDSLIYGGGAKNDSPYIFVYNPNNSWNPGTNPLRIKVPLLDSINAVQSLTCGKDSMIYIGTGIIATAYYYHPRLYKYNPFTQVVTHICQIPSDRYEISCLAATYTGKICGGLYRGSPSAASFFVYDPVVDSIIILESMGVESGVTDMVMGIDRQVYGITEDFLFKYNPDSSWIPGATPTNNPYKKDESFTYNSEKITAGNNGRLYISGINNFYSYDPRVTWNYGTSDTNNPRSYGNIISGETSSHSLTVGKDNLIYGGTGLTGYLYVFAPRPIFKAHFMTLDSIPWPFDVTMSDGNWVQELDSVTYFLREIPTYFTFSAWYENASHYSVIQRNFIFEPGSYKEWDFFALPPETLKENRFEFTGKETGSNVSSVWTYDSVTKVLSAQETSSGGALVEIRFDSAFSILPDYAIRQVVYNDTVIDTNSFHTYSINLKRWWNDHVVSCCDHNGKISGGVHFFFGKDGNTVQCTFAKLDTNKFPLGVRDVREKEFVLLPFSYTLESENGTSCTPEFLYPQFAVVPGSYVLKIAEGDSEYPFLSYPLLVELNELHSVVFSLCLSKKSDLTPFSFAIGSEIYRGQNSYQNFTHSTYNSSMSVDISTSELCDWHCYFVLPCNLMVNTLTAYTDSDTISLQEKYDYTVNHIDNYNIVVIRNECNYKHLELVYKSAYEWEHANVYTGTTLSDYCRALAIGDGNNDGVNELYGAGGIDRVYQSKKTNGTWVTTDLTGDIGDDMNGIAVGDVDTSFAGNEIYVGGDDARLQQIKWTGSSWSTTVVTTLGDNIKQVSIGDGNNDGISEVYCASLNNHAYQLKKNGSSWTTTDLTGDCGDDMYAVAVGDADSTFTGNEVYAGTKDGTSTDGRLYEITYTSGTWTKTTIADLGSHINWISVGDGNNDGTGEVYVACEDVHIYQFRKTNGSWVKTDIGTGQTGTAANMFQVVVGDGNNDADNEVFGVSRAIGTDEVGYVFQFKWNGSSWDKVEVSPSTNRGYFSIALGNADPNFTGNEVYGACDWTASPELLPHIYEFTYSSLLSYSMGNKKTILGNKEYVFEIKGKNPLTNQTVLKYSIPAESYVKLTLYEVSGRVAKRICNEKVKAGTYSVTLNSKGLKTGIYLVRFETEGFKSTKKLILIH